MNKYVKFKGYKNWFLVLNFSTDNSKVTSVNQNKLWTKFITQGLHGSSTASKNERLQFLYDFRTQGMIEAVSKLNYDEAVEKHGEIYVNTQGGYMTLRDNKIEEIVYSEYYPLDETPKGIVICENDEKPEYDWVQYLKNRFPDKSIYTINHFYLRDIEEIQELIKDCEIITFSTTFSNVQWYKNLIEANKIYNKSIIGYCHIEEHLSKALEIFNGIEVVDNIRLPYYNREDIKLWIDSIKF